MRFPMLHTLTLSSSDSATMKGCFLPGAADLTFPALTRLRLSDFASFSVLIADLGVSTRECAIVAQAHPDYRAMRTLVDGWRAMGVPLRSLAVDSPRFLDAGALNWLKKNVEEFTRLVPNMRGARVWLCLVTLGRAICSSLDFSPWGSNSSLLLLAWRARLLPDVYQLAALKVLCCVGERCPSCLLSLVSPMQRRTGHLIELPPEWCPMRTLVLDWPSHPTEQRVFP
ncbi:hypothetical protein FB45DRAFT_1138245 [Roridomyces roridus]|uniref:Uncharacterized protein n=1 Tax=Roridomyces roridus TaxID=1738132 RepID=A0AAD7FTE0_9AGAR|nr:hypothetical protein FB45DRAFT_1138245 [Roridomyces roridus]